MTMILQSNQSTRTVNTKNPKSNLRLVPNPFCRQHTVCSVAGSERIRWSSLERIRMRHQTGRPDTSGLKAFTIPDLLPLNSTVAVNHSVSSYLSANTADGSGSKGKQLPLTEIMSL